MLGDENRMHVEQECSDEDALPVLHGLVVVDGAEPEWSDEGALSAVGEQTEGEGSAEAGLLPASPGQIEGDESIETDVLPASHGRIESDSEADFGEALSVDAALSGDSARKWQASLSALDALGIDAFEEIDLFDGELSGAQSQSSMSFGRGAGEDEGIARCESSGESKQKHVHKSRRRSSSVPSVSVSDVSTRAYLELNVIRKRAYDCRFGLAFSLFSVIESLSLSPHCFISDSPYIKALSAFIGLSYFVHRQCVYASYQRLMLAKKPSVLAALLVRNNDFCTIRLTNKVRPVSAFVFFLRVCIEAVAITVPLLLLTERFNREKLDVYYVSTLLVFFTASLIEGIIETGISVLSLIYRSDNRAVGSVADYYTSSTATVMSRYYHIFALARTCSTVILAAILGADLYYKADVRNAKCFITLRFLPVLWTLFLSLNRGSSILKSREGVEAGSVINGVFSVLNLSCFSHLLRSSIDLITYASPMHAPLFLLDILMSLIVAFIFSSPMSKMDHLVCQCLIVFCIQLTLFLACSVLTKMSCSRAHVLSAVQLLSSSAYMALISASSLSVIIEPYYSDSNGLLFFSAYLIQLVSLGFPRYFNDKILLAKYLFKPRPKKIEALTDSKSLNFSGRSTLFNQGVAKDYGSTSVGGSVSPSIIALV